MKNTYIFWRRAGDTYSFSKSWVHNVVETEKGQLLELKDYDGSSSTPYRFLASDLEILKICGNPKQE